ncbi:MAG: RNA-directed DNA polymerase, partial [Solirubrobacteraceae bacterium]
MRIASRARAAHECYEFIQDLRSDRLAAWVPDVACDVDLGHLASNVSSGREQPFLALSVPRPDGGQMRVPVLHPAAIVALHRAVIPLRACCEQALAPGVISYRRGADRNWRYSPGWRTFSAAAEQLAGRARWVVFTDVKGFFESTPWPVVLRCARALSDRYCCVPLQDLTERLSAAGLNYLPSGYSDARMLGNLVLTHAERRLTVPFMRWVDDYRLFTTSEEQAEEELGKLAQGLGVFGLELNQAKTRIVPAHSALSEIRSFIAPIFDSDDSPGKIREKLIGALHVAAAEPTVRRSEMRYSLSALTRECEPAFIDWALQALWDVPWEAPRLIAYLASVAQDPRVGPGAESALRRAAQAGMRWHVCRLAPLVIHTRLGRVSPNTLVALAQALPVLSDSPAWGLALRTLSLSGARDLVAGALSAKIPDTRAALVALRDLDMALPAGLC